MDRERQVTVDLAGRHLLLAVPAYDWTLPVELRQAIAETVEACRKHGVRTTQMERSGSALIEKVRAEIGHQFLYHTDADCLLMVDSDIVWSPDDVLRLLAWSDTRDFVVAPYCTKEDEPVFYYGLSPGPDGKLLQDADGLVRCATAPGGFNLVTRAAMEALVAAYPELVYRSGRGFLKGEDVCALWHTYLRDGADGVRTYVGEDIAFCNRWTAIGGEIWMDPAISLGHIGRKIYRQDYGAWLTARAAQRSADTSEAA